MSQQCFLFCCPLATVDDLEEVGAAPRPPTPSLAVLVCGRGEGGDVLELRVPRYSQPQPWGSALQHPVTEASATLLLLLLLAAAAIQTAHFPNVLPLRGSKGGRGGNWKGWGRGGVRGGRTSRPETSHNNNNTVFVDVLTRRRGPRGVASRVWKFSGGWLLERHAGQTGRGGSVGGGGGCITWQSVSHYTRRQIPKLGSERDSSQSKYVPRLVAATHPCVDVVSIAASPWLQGTLTRGED